MPPTRRLVLAAVLALSVAACTGGDDEASERDTETSAEEFVRASVDLDVSRAELVSPHAPKGALDAGTRDAVAKVVEHLLLVTSAGPLVEGKAGAGFANLFTPDAGARAANADRAVFFDEGVEDFGELTPVESRVGLTGLAGSLDPSTTLVVARFVWTVEGERGDRIARTGELSLVPDDGAWKIGAYTIAVTRTIGQTSTTTTATSTP